MTPEEAKEAIRTGAIVTRSTIPDTVNFWYTVSCLSDDETYAYLKLRGIIYTGAPLTELVTAKQ